MPTIHSVPTIQPAKLAFRNHSAIAADLYFIDSNGIEQLTSVMPPFTIQVLDTFVGDAWRIREQFSQNELTTAVINLPVQEVSVNRESIRSGAPTTITFQNSSPLTVLVNWLDFLGQERNFIVLKPGESRVQSTYVTHPWLLRDQYSHAPVGVTVGETVTPFGDSPTPTTFNFTGTDLRSVPGGKSAIAVFENLSPLPLEVFWVDNNATEQPMAKLDPGASVPLSTLSQYVWRVKEPSSGTLAALFIANDTAKQFVGVKLDSFLGNPATSIEFRNETLLSVDLFWVDQKGEEVRFRTLAPKEIYTQATFAAQSWRIRDSHSGILIGMALAAVKPLTFRVTEDSIQSAVDPRPVTVTFTNKTPFDLSLSQIDPTGAEIAVVTIHSGASNQQTTTALHAFRFRELNLNHEVAFFVTSAGAQQNLDVLLRSYNSKAPAEITFLNQTSLNVSVVWMDYNGLEVPMRTLGAGAQTTMDTFLTQPWIVRDVRTGLVVDDAFADTQAQTVTILPQTLPVPRTDVAVPIQFLNLFPFAVDALMLDRLGRETLVNTLQPGANLATNTPLGQPWRVRQSDSAKELAFVLAGPGDNTIRMELSAVDSTVATTVDFFNATPLDVDIFNADAQGDETLAAPLPSRESTTVSTFVSHPFIVRERHSGQAIAFTVAEAGSQLLTITGDHLRALTSTVQVSVTLVNGSGLTLEIVEVDTTGASSVVGSLTPGQTVTRSSFFGRPWRFVPQGRSELVDMFLPSQDPNQTCQVQNKLVRTGMRASGVLFEGEVVLFDAANFTGNAFIVHADLPDLSVISGLANTAVSVQLGPNTAVTLFDQADFRGNSGVLFLSVPTLDGSKVPSKSAASVQIVTAAPPEQFVLSSTATLSEEYQVDSQGAMVKDASGNPAKFSAYRSIVTFPPQVGAVDVFASSQVTIQVAGQQHTIDPILSVRLAPNLAQKLMLIVEASQIGTAGLLLRTNGMADNERAFVFPDQDLHNRVAAMAPGTIAANKNKFGIAGDVTDQTCNSLQSAIQSLSGAIRSVGGPTGNLSRLVVADNMEFAAWSLDMNANGGVLYRPLSPSEIVNLAAGAAAGHGLAQDFLGIGAAFTKLGNTINQVVIQPVANAVVTVAEKTVTAVKNDIVIPAVTLVEDDVVKPAEKIAQQAADVLAGVAQQALQFAGNVANQALAIIIKSGTQVVTFVLDTAEKVGEVIASVMQQIGASVEKLIQQIQFIFDWNDILDTHSAFVSLVNRGFAKANDALDILKTQLMQALSRLQQSALTSIDQELSSLGLNQFLDQASSSDGSNATGNNDQSDWFTSKVSENGRQTSVAAGGPTSDALAFLDNIINTLQQQFTANGPVVLDALTKAGDAFQAAFQNPENAAKLLLGAFLELAKGVLIVGIGVLETVLEIVLDGIKTLLGSIKDVINLPIQIPFITDLYKSLTNADLTVLDLACLFAAIPATIITKLATGLTPAPALAGLTLDADPDIDVKAGLFAVTQIFAGILTPVIASFEGTEDDDDAIVAKIFKAVNLLLEFVADLMCIPFAFKGFPPSHSSDALQHWSTAPEALSFDAWCALWSVFASDCLTFGVGLKAGLAKAAAPALNFLSFLTNSIYMVLTIQMVGSTGSRIQKAKAVDLTSDAAITAAFLGEPNQSLADQRSELTAWKAQDGTSFGLLAASNIVAAFGPWASAGGAMLNAEKPVSTILLAISSILDFSTSGIVIAQIATGSL